MDPAALRLDFAGQNGVEERVGLSELWPVWLHLTVGLTDHGLCIHR